MGEIPIRLDNKQEHVRDVSNDDGAFLSHRSEKKRKSDASTEMNKWKCSQSKTPVICEWRAICFIKGQTRVQASVEE